MNPLGKTHFPIAPTFVPAKRDAHESTKSSQPDRKLVEQGPAVSPEVARLLSAEIVITEESPQHSPDQMLSMKEASKRVQIVDQNGEVSSFVEAAHGIASTTARVTGASASLSQIIAGTVNVFNPIPEGSIGEQARMIVPTMFNAVASVATAIELTTEIPEYQKREAEIKENREKLDNLREDIKNPRIDKKELSYQISVLKNKIADLEKAQSELQQKAIISTLEMANGRLEDASALGLTFAAHGSQAAEVLSTLGSATAIGGGAISIATASAAIIEDTKLSEKVISEFDKLKALHIDLKNRDPASPLLPIIGSKINQLQQQNDDLIASITKSLVVITSSGTAAAATIAGLAGAAVGSTGGIAGIVGAALVALGGLAYLGYKNRDYISKNVVLDKISQVVKRERIEGKKDETIGKLAEKEQNINLLTRQSALNLINHKIKSLLNVKETLIEQQEKGSIFENIATSIKIAALDSRIKDQVDSKLELLEDTGYDYRHMELLQEEIETRTDLRKNLRSIMKVDRNNEIIGMGIDETSKNIERAKAMMGATYQDVLDLSRTFREFLKIDKGDEIKAFLKEMNHDFDPLEFERDPVSVIWGYIVKEQK